MRVELEALSFQCKNSCILPSAALLLCSAVGCVRCRSDCTASRRQCYCCCVLLAAALFCNYICFFREAARGDALPTSAILPLVLSLCVRYGPSAGGGLLAVRFGSPCRREPDSCTHPRWPAAVQLQDPLDAAAR